MIWTRNKWQAYGFTPEGNLISTPFYWISDEDAGIQSRRETWYQAMEDLAGRPIQFIWLESFEWEDYNGE